MLVRGTGYGYDVLVGSRYMVLRNPKMHPCKAISQFWGALRLPYVTLR